MLEVAHALTVEDDRDDDHARRRRGRARAAQRASYGDDEHYDIISAFIKSIRGSDPDAGLYWLARMLEAGEDPRFIARRLVILASEDVGLADPHALLVADAAARASSTSGCPRPALNLAHAVLHLSAGAEEQQRDHGARVQRDRGGPRPPQPSPVPIHLRDAHYRGAQMLGHGKGYVYPHDAPAGLGAAGAPAGGGRGGAVLPAGPARRRARAVPSAARAASDETSTSEDG